MDMYPKYKSALGYQVGDNGIDSYGVNHNNFSLRDELEYQMARTNRESQLINRYNQQGINNNYPQQGVGFWGNSAENNYGFGNSNIGGNIENVTNQLNTGGFNNQQTFGTNSYGNAANSAITQPNSYVNNGSVKNQFVQDQTPIPWNYNAARTQTTTTPWNNPAQISPVPCRNNQTLTPWAGGYDLSRYPQSNVVNQQIGATSDFSKLRDTPLYIGLTAQFGQAHLRGLDTSLIQNRAIVNSPYSNNILENDCYQSPRFEPFARQVRWNEGENQGILYATPQKHGTDQPTMYGISQGALDLYRNKYEDIARTYPANVKDLTEDQAMNLLCQYYKGSRTEAINDPNLAFAVYDSYFNGDKNAVSSWQKSINELYPTNIAMDGVIGSELINTYNSDNITDRAQLYDTYLKYRLPTVKSWARKGIRNRTMTYR